LLSLLGRIRITYGYSGKKKRIKKGNFDDKVASLIEEAAEKIKIQMVG